ncbi:MAG: ParB N-terminal domain-containing protein [Phycisphaerales bacterium]
MTTATTTQIERVDLPLDALRGRADNANAMPRAAFRKLVAHLDRTGRYPPIIVRPCPDEPDAYEILDGHHRVKALRAIGRAATARCEVWPVDDAEALTLLTTLNRLEGRDDPAKRTALIAELTIRLGAARVAERLPESKRAVEKLARLASTAPPAPARPPRPESIPEPITFFLTRDQRALLELRLAEFDGSRSKRLVALLDLDDEGVHP